MASASLFQVREKRISVRLMWPFLRIINSSPSPLTRQFLEEAGISPVDLARPDTRLPHRLVMSILEAWVEHSGDRTIGLRAGASVEPGDLDPIEPAARSCRTFRDALDCAARYMHLVHEAVDVAIVDSGDHALWRYRITDGVPQPRAANDFVIAAAASFSLRCASVHRMPLEVHFMHDAPASALDDYAAFHRSIVRFGMPHNGFVLERTLLDSATRAGNVRMHEAFDRYARELSERATLGARSRAREAIIGHLGRGDMCMDTVAAGLGMSVPTLRRRLEEERTTFSDLVDDVRRELAERYLRDPDRSISEIASLLGFAHAPAFHKAFRRWKGVTPTAHRARM
jgi:AraC-like DNA-binding protein